MLMLVCSSIVLFAQDGKLVGKITDAANKEALVGASIMANPGVTNKTEVKGAVTDIDGNYSISLSPGIYFVD